MMHAKSDSDETSLGSSSPKSPKANLYYVQSPSRDSSDGDKSSTIQTPSLNSPMDSPSHMSVGRHSRESSGSRFSGTFRSSWAGRGIGRKRNYKRWPQCKVIVEEGSFDEVYGQEKGVSRRCQAFIGVLGFMVIFSVFCLIIWGAGRPYKAQIQVKSLNVHSFYVSGGSDMRGVPTKMLTANCSVSMNVYNPATFFGIHVSSIPVNLMYLEITVATGELKKYYQPRRSNRIVHVNLIGNSVPLYGAGATIEISGNERVPLTLVFEVRSQGNVVGMLVRTKHCRRISCSLIISNYGNKPVKLEENSCKYE